MAIADYVRRSGTFLFRNQLLSKQLPLKAPYTASLISDSPTHDRANALKESCLNSDRYISMSVHLFARTLNENRVLLFTLNGAKLSVIVVTERVEVDDHSAIFSE